MNIDNIIIKALEDYQGQDYITFINDTYSDVYEYVSKEIMSEEYPSRIEKRGGFMTPYGLYAIYEYPFPDKPVDAWNKALKEEAIFIRPIRCYVDWEHIGISYEEEVDVNEYMQKKYKFCIVTNEKQKEIINAIAQYFEIDIDDKKDTPQIMAIYPVAMNNNSKNIKWNELAKKLANDDIDRYYNRYLYNVNKCEEILKTNNIEYKKIEFNIGDKQLYQVKYDIKYKEYNKEVLAYPDIIMKEIEKINRLKNEEEKIEALKNSNAPIFTVYDGNKVVFQLKYKDIIDNNYNVILPKNIVGHFIGSGGSRIKFYEKTYYGGRKINVVPTDAIKINKIRIK